MYLVILFPQNAQKTFDHFYLLNPASNKPNPDEHVKRITQVVHFKAGIWDVIAVFLILFKSALKLLPELFHQQNWEEYWKRSSFPLPALQFLNLAGNKVRWIIPSNASIMTPCERRANMSYQIAEEEALMAAALFPMIQEIDIHSNPLTVQRSGNRSSLLQSEAVLEIGFELSGLKSPWCLWLQGILSCSRTTSKRDWG